MTVKRNLEGNLTRLIDRTQEEPDALEEIPWDSGDFKEGLKEAVGILRSNDLGHSTKPAPELYPHQWNWDSGFIAVGLSRFDQQRAQTELSTLFEAQWDNGMVPQIVFNMDELGDYFPEPDFWEADRSPHYPDTRETSGITMPPVHGMAAKRILDNATDRDRALEWLEGLYPKLIEHHEYFYRDRDPNNEGLTYIRHPWESGIDNSPAWDPVLECIDLDEVHVPSYERKDLDHDIPSDQRPEDNDYDRYVHLIEVYRRNNYDEADVYEDCPFLVQDPLFNAILCYSGEALVEIGDELGADTTEIEQKTDSTRRAIRDKLWSDQHNLFFPYDMGEDQLVEVPTAMSFLPMLCGAPTEDQAKRMYKVLESCSFCPMHEDHCFSVPNYDMRGEFFQADNYWRGPIWINVNWLLMNGLRRYGFTNKFTCVRADIIELIHRWGFHEYFDPFEGEGYGTDGFSWSAALYIDAVSNLLEAVTDE